MPFIHHILEGAALLVRQATDTTTAVASAAVTSAAAAATTAAAASVAATTTTGVASVVSSLVGPSGTGTGTVPPQTPTPSGNNNNNNNNSNTGSSPLLFFVALGFGVVFTNLWIIVGVKYCFRYNARARQLRLAAEDGEPINLEDMPHPRRRRREKKLMSIDEVNEKFPMVKYKTWVASRARDGLPTRGGVDAPADGNAAPSRATSVRSARGVVAPMSESEPEAGAETQPQARPSASDPAVASGAKTAEAEEPAKPVPTTTTTAVTAAASSPGTGASAATPDAPRAPEASSVHDARASIVSDGEAGDGDLGVLAKDKDVLVRTSDEQYNHSDDDDDEHIDAALPPECVGTSGDTCAICIDTLEDDDDVRGLTCGHAFHAVCLDPWLTSRRACCPLCKADYYTPRPRATANAAGAAASGAGGGAAADGADGTGSSPAADAGGPGIPGNPANPVPIPYGDDRRNRMNLPLRPIPAWRGFRDVGNSLVPPQLLALGRRAQAANAAGPAEATAAGAQQPAPASSSSGWRANLRPFRRRQEDAAGAAAAAPAVTPSQLEAGVRSQS